MAGATSGKQWHKEGGRCCLFERPCKWPLKGQATAALQEEIGAFSVIPVKIWECHKPDFTMMLMLFLVI